MGFHEKIGPIVEKHYIEAVLKEVLRVDRMFTYHQKQTNNSPGNNLA